MHGPRAPPRPPAAAAAPGRYIGLVVVPGAVIVRIEADDAPVRRGWGFAAATTQVATSVA